MTDPVRKADGNRMPHIDKIWAFLSIDKDGDEAVCGMAFNGGWIAMVAADFKRVESLMPVAKAMAELNGMKIKLVEFTTRREIAEIGSSETPQ
jgi:hypothetical protein